MLNPFQARAVTAYVAGYRRIALRAGWGSGKSYALGTIARLAGEQGANVLWVTDSGSRIETVVQPVCEALLRPMGWRWESVKRRWSKGGAAIWLRSYFRPNTKSAESNSVEGSNVSVALIDETQTFRDAEVIRKLFGRSRSGPVAPCIVMAGLPVWNPWWEDEARKLGPKGCVVHGTSYDNRANLRPEWFADALETLGRREFDAMLLNRPQPPEGQIYDTWRPESWPEGNIIDGWAWEPTMRTVWAIDFGKHRPSALLFAKDPGLDAWVLCAEVNPRRSQTLAPDLASDMLRVAWPRYLGAQRPAGVPYLFDDAVADPAGKASRTDVETSDLDTLAELPAGIGVEGCAGIGLRPQILDGRSEDYADRNSVRSGIVRTRRAMERQRILCTREVWQAGLDLPAGARSFARAVMGYRRNAIGEPVKGDGNDDVMDTVRYLVRWPGSGLWFAHPLDLSRPLVWSGGAGGYAAARDR